ncbi:sigma-54-dependent Fis family transcriptional regulator [uncultured Clostridium sp.]|uniref:sigma-54 interaction domain-containing protein n=1 Tax=uncultured Clostridium sp. TaxID=59620 RepID=UPI00258592CE|nr:sigma 54-interacting transcriptional regulator [uncultured Clostridium sp.]MDU1350927.1 sigma 54-interacting transcriptional regulator [Clostridium argentinense]
MKITEWMEKIFNSLNEGVLIVDRDGNILFFNKAYSNFIGKNLNDVKGLPIRDIRPGSVIQDVMETGVAKLGLLRKESNDEYFCNISPIISDGKTIGGISTVTFLRDAVYLSKKIKELEKKNKYLMEKIHRTNGTKYTFDNIIAVNENSILTKNIAKKIAHSDISVLIEGESGSGKEVYAQSIHNESERGKYPFVAINCSTLAPTMLEGELFGYEDGAFTGAKKGGKIGLFESANQGTIFLDEISEMDYSLQAKLLRVLQEGTIRKIGGTKEIDIDVRVICACNVDLMKYIEEGKFRKDLYYRIAVFPIHIVPLRERREDIPYLLDLYLEKLSNKFRRKISLTDKAKASLYNYDWPGNVREMRNVLEFSAIMATDGFIREENLPTPITESSKESEPKFYKLSDKIKKFEREEINKAIEYFGDTVNGKKEAAKHLGISLSTLYYKLS